MKTTLTVLPTLGKYLGGALADEPELTLSLCGMAGELKESPVMIIIGELINASRKTIKAAIEAGMPKPFSGSLQGRPKPALIILTSMRAFLVERSPSSSSGWCKPYSR